MRIWRATINNCEIASWQLNKTICNTKLSNNKHAIIKCCSTKKQIQLRHDKLTFDMRHRHIWINYNRILVVRNFLETSMMSSQILFISSFISLVLFATSFSTSKEIYLTMNNFFVIFIEKFKSINLIYRQRNEFFSYYWQLNKLVISRQTRIIFYFLFVLSIFKKSKKLDSNRQSSFVAKKLINVERFDLKRVLSFFSILFWISRIRDHFSWIFHHSNIWQKHHTHWHKSWRFLR